MRRIVITILLMTFSFFLWAGTPLKGYEEEYYSFLTLMGKTERPYLVYRTIANNSYSNANGFWSNSNLTKTKNGLTIYGPDVFTSYNTARPWGQNDGSLWQGVGFNAKARLGLSYSSGWFYLNLQPELDFSQNQEYPLMHNTYNYIWGTLDKPQRYGDSSFFAFSPGDSEIRFNFRSFSFGIGYAELWTGPTYLNSVLHSNNAPTYPRIDIGFNNLELFIPWTDIPIGTFEFHYDLGILQNSEYANASPGEKSLLHIMTIAWRPSFIEELTVGVMGVGHTDFSWESIPKLYSSVIDSQNKGEDLKLAFTFDFLFPEVGFEVYGEIGVDDYYYFIVNAFHTMVWQLGLKKGFVLDAGKDLYLQFLMEFGNMTMSHDAFINWPLNFYTHSNTAASSYSNNGQLLGAGTGWAGNSQYGAIQLYYRRGMTQVFFQRSNPDNNYILAKVANTGVTWPNDNYYCFKGLVDLGIGTFYHFLNGFSFSASFVYEFIANDQYREEAVPDNLHFPELNNYHIDFGLVLNI